MFENLKLSDIPKNKELILRKQTSTSPVIWRVSENGIKAVVKDFSHNGFWFRNIVGRFLIWREKKAYKRLGEFSGVPALLGSIGGIALIIEEVQGIDMGTIEGTDITPDEKFYKDLKNLIDRFHERGIIHCDLKRAPNIILGNDGNPYIIDWAAAISKSELSIFPFSLIYKRFLQDDLNAITKIKLKHCPENVGDEEKRRYTERGRVEMVIRGTKNRLRNFLKKIA